jgi:cubilin
VFIYDGENEKAALLGVYTGTTIPPTINSSSNKLFLKFKTDSSKESKGWMAEYHSVYPIYCSGMTTLTSDSGSFSNGSGGKNYNNNANCKWRIQPPNAGAITLSFNSFDLEEHDKLSVYSVGASTVLLGTFTGKKKPDPIVSPTGALLIMFNSNGYNPAAGFDASYTSTITGTEALDISGGMTIYPNPFTNLTTFTFILEKSANVNICVFDIFGRLVAEPVNEFHQVGEQNIQWNTEGLPSGLYFCRLKAGNQFITRKVVKM